MTTDAQRSESAVKRVFRTTELLEAILLELQVRDVLLAQRTATVWKRVVSGSKKLQQMLYFTPYSMAEAKLLEDQLRILEIPAYRNIFEMNPFLQPLLRELSCAISVPETRRALGLPRAWQYPDASWRNMHFAKLPLVRIELLVYVHSRSAKKVGYMYACSSEGVTAGSLMDTLLNTHAKSLLYDPEMSPYRGQFLAEDADGMWYHVHGHRTGPCVLWRK